ncbi:MAG: methionyl-tRNA formyltransferase [bacterium]|nr:methionyl-tRNA formyltransferase [bacterium]
MNKYKLIFIGTSSFGLPAFTALASDPDFEIILTITQPDLPAGRRQIITASPIKLKAEEKGIAVLQPQFISDIREKILSQNPDLIVVAAYGQLIPEDILNIPQFGCLNLHASLLPKYRGSAVIQAAILNGDRQTGITVMKLDKGLDTGPILAQSPLNIAEDDTAETLRAKLAAASADFLANAIKRYLTGEISPAPQDSSLASFAKTLTKSDGLVDWTKPADYLEKFIRAMWPWPAAWTWWNGKQVKIISAQNQPLEISSYKPGKTFKYNSGLAVQCGQNALIIKKLQLEGKTALDSQEFLRGQKDFMGSVLG